MTHEEIKSVNRIMAAPYKLTATTEQVNRVDKNLNCKHCTGRRHKENTRCGKCKIISEHLKNGIAFQIKAF